MAKHDFKTLKPRISSALNTVIRSGGVPADPKGYAIVDGFVISSLTNHIGNDAGYVLTGEGIPQVMIVGNSTGIVYYFAIGTLLPGIRF